MAKLLKLHRSHQNPNLTPSQPIYSLPSTKLLQISLNHHLATSRYLGYPIGGENWPGSPYCLGLVSPRPGGCPGGGGGGYACEVWLKLGAINGGACGL